MKFFVLLTVRNADSPPTLDPHWSADSLSAFASHSPNTLMPKWNKTERNTPGVSSPLLDNQALPTRKTERPFHFPFTNAHRSEKSSELIRSNPNLHAQTASSLTHRCNSTATPLQPLQRVAPCCSVLHCVARKIFPHAGARTACPPWTAIRPHTLRLFQAKIVNRKSQIVNPLNLSCPSPT
jgi:hypothetical protein